MNETILVDTGAWIALFDQGDDHHRRIRKYADLIENFPLIVPWPIAYETLRTRFVRKPTWVYGFEAQLKRPGVMLIDDNPYRDDALALTIESARTNNRHLSTVDVLCRLIIDDPRVRVDHLITPNKRDFIDVCLANRVDIIP